jgi:hypothetical protein
MLKSLFTYHDELELPLERQLQSNSRLSKTLQSCLGKAKKLNRTLTAGVHRYNPLLLVTDINSRYFWRRVRWRKSFYTRVMDNGTLQCQRTVSHGVHNSWRWITSIGCNVQTNTSHFELAAIHEMRRNYRVLRKTL